MSIKIKYFIGGFLTLLLLQVFAVIGIFYFYTNDNNMTFHEQTLTSGKKLKITMCNFVWGVDHSDRYSAQDSFALEYVMSSPTSTQEQQDQEVLEAFELIRPISEQWKIDKAQISVFPTLKRKGTYYIYYMIRDQNGEWTFTRDTAKVHINDA